MRARVTVLAVAAVAAVLVVVSVGLVIAQRALLTRSLDDLLQVQAREVADGYARGDPGPIAGNGIAWQVVDGDQVVASDGLDGRGPVAEETAGTRTLAADGELRGWDGPVRVHTLRSETGGRTIRVHTAASLDEVLDAAEVLATSLAVAVPVTVLVLGGVIWLLVGRTLRPVEDIRAEVATIGATDLHRRVPEPGTGDEVSRLAQTMNGMLDRLERSIDAQRRFVADASHELRSPLTRIRTQLEVARPGEDVDALRASLLEDAGELSSLVDDLLFLARSDDPGVEHVAQPVDLDEIVLREVGRARQRASASRPDEVAIDASGVTGAEVRGDATALGRAVRNLLDNAVRHADGRVAVSLAETQSGHVVLTVGDDGPGIPLEAADAVFERFTRLDDARARDDGGAGLGLAIVREVVSRHGGDVVVARSAAGGAELVVALPGRRG